MSQRSSAGHLLFRSRPRCGSEQRKHSPLAEGNKNHSALCRCFTPDVLVRFSVALCGKEHLVVMPACVSSGLNGPGPLGFLPTTASRSQEQQSSGSE